MNQEEKGKKFSKRLSLLILEDGNSKKSIAEDAEITAVTLSRYLKGRIPDTESLMRLSSRLRVNASWLLTGEGEKEPGNLAAIEAKERQEALLNKVESNATILSEKLTEIPVLSWAHAGEAMAYEQMPQDYLEPMVISSSAINGYKAFGLIVDGDSMEPIIGHGDQIAVMQDCEPRNGCFVVAKFAQDAGVMVRRYQVLSAPNGKPEKVSLIPYNQLYRPTEHHISEFEWIMPVAAMARKMW